MSDLSIQETQWRERLAASGIPAHLHDGLVYYLAFHKRPGSFLTHVLENNLMGAVSRADDISALALASIVRFLVNQAPMVAWGSPDAVEQWLHLADEAVTA